MKQLLVFLLLLCAASVSAQDVIVKKDGSTVVCRVVELTDTEITYKKWSDLNGSNYVMDRSLASAINYENGKREEFSSVQSQYLPGNQNDGVQQYNDKALLAIDAQVHPKKKLASKWNLRVGYSIDLWHVLSTSSGFDASFGISNPFGHNGMFWGIDAGVMSYNTKYKDNYTYSKLSISPIVLSLNPYIGINIPLSQNMHIAPYIGPYAGYVSEVRKNDYYEISGKANMSVYRYLRTKNYATYGINAGVELHLSKTFFVDLHLKKSFHHDVLLRVNPYSIDEINSAFNAMKIVLGVGLQF